MGSEKGFGQPGTSTVRRAAFPFNGMRYGPNGETEDQEIWLISLRCMPEQKSDFTIPREAVQTLLAAAVSRVPLTEPLAAEVRIWLKGVVERALERMQAKPIIMADVERFGRAYRRFCRVLDDLQDRDDPPSAMRVSESGATDWDNWLRAYEVFGFKRGKPEKGDWKLIADLIAFYEMISGRRAAASQEGSPTMRFLAPALAELRRHVPAQVHDRFACPNSDALKQQLPRLRAYEIPAAAKRLKGSVNVIIVGQ